MNPSALDELCRLAGIALRYEDIWGKTHEASRSTLLALLQAMDVIRDESGIADALAQRAARAWRQITPPVAVFCEEAAPYRLVLHFPETARAETVAWRLALETGETRQGEFQPSQLEQLDAGESGGVRYIEVAFDWRERLPTGYHRFVAGPPEGASAGAASFGAGATSLIITPSRCYLPAALDGSGRTWGAAAQLYSVRSARNWGIGDYTDLAVLVDQWARRGAGVMGVNPLHALYPHNPAHASPYSPSSRRFLNVLYIDVEATEDFSECEEARAQVHAADFQARLAAARASELVDYPAVAALKLPVLQRIYRHFREHHLRGESARARAFRAFQAAGGAALRQHALFDALQQRFHEADAGVWGFPVWPEAYRDPRSAEVARYAETHVERVEFHEYLQWLADRQLGHAAEQARAIGMEVGLYADLAVSIDSAGAEAWSNQDCYVLGATLGAPPDEINLNGQNWGLPPLHPERLRDAAYLPFIELLRANMRHAGALRIDHVMGLARLFWIPRGRDGADGAYVAYPFDDLLGVVALESHRNRCLVIGEDLGTVPDEVRAGLARTGVLSYRLLFFERAASGNFQAPADYPVDALVAASTHDLPTLAGYWEGYDLQLRQALALYPSEDVREAQIVGRAQDRARLVLALEHERLLPEGLSAATPTPLGADALRAIQVYLARSPARVLIVQLEDVLGVREQTNLPGTTDEHHNWRRKLPLDLERLPDDPRFVALAAAVAAERPLIRARRRKRALPVASIPRATYRLQLHAGFTLADATALVPYLAQLGVSHVYCSPYLRARPGSTHGYDTVDHNALNPEIGSREDLERFVAALRARGMGHILDIVPNHVGVMGADSVWWLDVLENGPAAAHAGYFDIEWRPPDTDLAHKLLVPVLGEHYGLTLERDGIELKFDPAEGSFSAWYHEHRFPIDPRDYPALLERALAGIDRAAAPESALAELATLAAEFGRLPTRDETAPDRALERRRAAAEGKQRLARLAATCAPVADGLAGAARACGGAEGREALHELLERQAWRLAYWRVASDEINYRRFFDINDLAALRMQDEAVFESTHRLVLNLAADGKLDGLRIDHPDGLYDPAGYFDRLQRRYVEFCGFEPPPALDRAALPLYLVAEKIIAGHENVPETWAVHGTTGYRFAAVVNGLFINGAAREEMDRIYRACVPDAVAFEESAYEGRRAILRGALASALTMLSTELLRIARSDRATRDYTLNTLRQALSEVISCFPVYRTYIAGKAATEQDRRYIQWAVARARRRSRAADLSIFEFIHRMLLAEPAPDAGPELAARIVDFAMRFQQLTAPVAAKGVEDTAFYRYNRLVSLNDVGADPQMFGFPVSAFHGASAERAALWPHTMLATSTHDNKRAEDVRARIDVLSEMPADWQALVQRWARMNRSRKRVVDEAPAPSPNDEYLLYQTLLGTMPARDVSGEALARYRARISDYMIKAVREAKAHTSWTAPSEEYEGAVAAFVDALLGEADRSRNRFLKELRGAHDRFEWFGWLNSLSITLLKFASPGVPDIYQGTELIDLSLVDPDNRRPVDYAGRRRVLHELEPIASGLQPVARLAGSPADGRAKLWIIWRALQFRARHPNLFAAGGYVPLSLSGARAENVVAFARRYGNLGLIAVAGRLWASLGLPAGMPPLGRSTWQDTAVDLAPLGEIEEPFDLLSLTVPRIENGALLVSEALSQFPGALVLCRLAAR